MKDGETELDSLIDLRKYVLLLVSRWRFIRDILVVVALATLFFSLAGPGGVVQYEAIASLALVKSKTAVNLQDQIKTISPDMAAAQTSTTRSSTLAALVKNQLVAQQAVKTMGDRLPSNLRDPAALSGMVHGQVRKGTDIVDIVVRGEDTAVVKDIANAWAAAYETYVNQLYSGGGTLPGSIDQDVAAAKAEYEMARDELIHYQAGAQSYRLQREIDYRKGVISALESSRQFAISTILTKTVQIQTDAVGKYQSSALGLYTLPATKEVDDRVSQLTALYANKAKLQQTLVDAQTLRDQASQSPSGADSNSLALLLIKAQLATAGGLPSGLQLQVGAQSASAGGSASQVSDLDALITTLNSRLNDVQASIDTQSADLEKVGILQVKGAGVPNSSTSPFVAQAQRLAGDLLQLQGMDGVLANIGSDENSPLTETLDRLTSAIKQLETDLMREQYHIKELSQNYSDAWNTYTTLQSKAQEMDISAKLPGNEVSFVSPATRPSELGVAGRLTRLLNNLMMAILLAFVVGVAGVFAVEFTWPGLPNIGIPWISLWRWASRRPTGRETVATNEGNLQVDDA